LKNYKITCENEIHNGFQFHDGLNIDTVPFNPNGSCKPGGIYYSSKDILHFLGHGPWIREVIIQGDAQIYKDPCSPEKWKSDKPFLGPRRRITWEIVQELIKEGASIPCGWGSCLNISEMPIEIVVNGSSKQIEQNLYAILKIATAEQLTEIRKKCKYTDSLYTKLMLYPEKFKRKLPDILIKKIQVALNTAVKDRYIPAIEIFRKLGGNLSTTKIAIIAAENNDVELLRYAFQNGVTPVADNAKLMTNYTRMTTLKKFDEMTMVWREFLIYIEDARTTGIDKFMVELGNIRMNK